MAKISTIVLVYNVSKEVVPTLKCAKYFSDEIIVIDTGSTDNGATLKAVKPYANKIFSISGPQDFAKWRNQGAKLASGDWLLYLDSDERVTPALANEIKAAVNTDGYSAYLISRYEVLLGRHLSHWPDPNVLRLIRKSSLEKWVGRVHEQPQINGPIGKLANQLVHLTHKNIDEKVTNTLNWSHIESDMLIKANHPKMAGWRFFRIMLTEFWFRAIKQRLWLDGVEGSIEIIYQMFSKFITYVRLWEKQRQPSLQHSYDNIDKQILDQWKSK